MVPCAAGLHKVRRAPNTWSQWRRKGTGSFSRQRKGTCPHGSIRFVEDLALDGLGADVAHVLALDEEDHVLGDVLGVVADPLE